MLRSRIRHHYWGLEIIWGKVGDLQRAPRIVGDSHQSEAQRQEKAEGSVAWLAPRGRPGFKTKINLEEPEGRKERNKQTSSFSLHFLPTDSSKPSCLKLQFSCVLSNPFLDCCFVLDGD